MRKICITILSSVILFGITNCSNEHREDSLVRINGTVSNPSHDQILVFSLNPLREMITLDEATVDPSGHFEIDFELKEETEAYLQYGKNRASLFLEPEFHLNVSFDASNFRQTLSFNGKGAHQNTLLQELHALDYRYGMKLEATPEDFRKNIKSWTLEAEAKINDLHTDVSNVFRKIQQNKIKNRFPNHFFQYVKNYRTRTPNGDMFEFTEKEKDPWKDLDLQDPGLLISEDHRKTVQTYISHLTYDVYHLDPATNTSKAKKKVIKDFLLSDAHSDYKEFIIASDISDELDYSGYARVSSRYEAFIEQYPDSRFSKPLKNRFSKWLKLTKGNPAPEFSGISPDGSRVSLSDFYGNVVYVDIWASWCKPCYEEFPYSRQLKEAFSNEEKVVFMYVSIDDEKNAWLKGLDRIRDMEGVHILSENAWQSQIAKDYIINDIPRYILIDREGKIADIEAKRPSSGVQLANDIRALL